MNRNLTICSILGDRHIVEIIMYLYHFGDRSRSEIYNAVITSSFIPKKLQMLEECGIIRRRVTSDGPTLQIGLTHLGNLYGEYLSHLEEMTGGDLDLYRMAMIKKTRAEGL